MRESRLNELESIYGNILNCCHGHAAKAVMEMVIEVRRLRSILKTIADSENSTILGPSVMDDCDTFERAADEANRVLNEDST